VSYLRSIYLHKDKSIFRLAELPVEKFAEALGLPGAPKIKFLNREVAKQKNLDMTAEAAKAEVLKTMEADIDGTDSSDEEGDRAKRSTVSHFVFLSYSLTSTSNLDCSDKIRPHVRAEKSKHSFGTL